MVHESFGKNTDLETWLLAMVDVIFRKNFLEINFEFILLVDVKFLLIIEDKM
mgnify:CR=1 FL=1